MTAMANEVLAGCAEDQAAFEDRQLFVHNLGVLLSQTREGIVGAELDQYEIVTVTFRGGHQTEINVNADSYMAIVRDVAKAIK